MYMGKQELYMITVPSHFRCPISLDVMKSPVSLCTGVTYDRTSIQRWLDAGHNTCPATMQVLPTTDFVPNHTLHRLIHIWSTTHSRSGSDFLPSISSSQAASLLHDIDDDDDNNGPRFLKLLFFASESPDNTRFLSRNDAFLDMLVRKTTRFNIDDDKDSDLLESSLKILQQIYQTCDDAKSKLRTAFLSPETLASAARILRFGRRDSKIAIVGLIETLASDSESKIAVLDNQEILTELVKGLIPTPIPSPKSGADLITESFLSCILCLSTPKRNKQRLVRAGVVREVGRVLCRRETRAAATEAGIKLLELMLGCSEGRTAICEDRECVAGVVGRLLRASEAASESGVVVLWSVCCWLRDQRAREAVETAANAFARILLVMQSGCSSAAKRMCGDLLRIFQVNSKASLGSYDTNTIHIMPF